MSADGVLSGTAPATAGFPQMTLQITVSAHDSSTPPLAASSSYSLNVLPGLELADTAMADGVVTAAYSQSLSATGGTTPYSWSIASGALPAGLTLNSSTGQIAGTPTTSGTFTITIQVQDATGSTATRQFTIVVETYPAITTFLMPAAKVGVPYSQALTATGGTLPYTWSLTGKSLPAGLTLNPSTGVISGTPTTAGIYSFNPTVTCGAGVGSTSEVYIVIDPAQGQGVLITSTAPPGGVAGTPYSAALAAAGGTTPYSWSIAGGALPAGLTLSASTGVISGMPTTVGNFAFTVQVQDAVGASAIAPWTMKITAPLSVTTASLPNGAVGQPYYQTLAATGGTPPYAWWIAAGNLPAGLSYNPRTGVISGTPTMAGGFSFPVSVLDALAAGDTKQLSISVGTNLLITTAALPNATLNGPYSQTLAATGGTPPYSWSITSGALPSGLTLNASTGVISGTPTVMCSGPFTVQVRDATNVTATRGLSLTVGRYLMITTVSLSTLVVGRPGSITLTATGDVMPYTWSIISGALPAGLTLASGTGVISGTPTTLGSSTFTVQVQNAAGATDSAQLTIVVQTDFSISTTSLPGGPVGVPYSQTLTAAGGALPYTWSLTAGALPAGLTLNPGTGVISGTPTAGGSSTFIVQVQNSTGATAFAQLTITIQAGLVITTASLPGGTVGVPYSQTLTATGGALPYTWSIIAGALPAGLTLNPATGVISGTPTTAGVFGFNPQVRDTANAGGSTWLSIPITASQPVTITTSALPDGVAGVPYTTTLVAIGGTPPYAWSVSGLPTGGLGIDMSSGVLWGTPREAGAYTAVVTVLDRSVPRVSAVRSFSLNIAQGPLSVASTGVVHDDIVGNKYSASMLAASGGVRPYTWSISAGSLPNGLALTASSGLIEGVPTAAGLFNFSLQVQDSAGARVITPLTMKISSGQFSITTTLLAAATVGAAYSQTLSATNGTAPYTWTIIAGALPDGLALSPAAGLISGKPVSAGTFNFLVEVQDSASGAAEKQMSISVAAATAAPAIQTQALPSGKAGTVYSQTLAATGGTPPYTWSIASGTLPPGLTLDASSGRIAGTPAQVGQSGFTVQLQDSRSAVATAAESITINAADLNRIGVFSQVASGAGWRTSLYLVNEASTAAPVVVNFWADGGGALLLPLTVTQMGGTSTVTAATLNTTVGANSTVLIESASELPAGLTGWAEVLSASPVKGYGVFHYTSPAGAESEGSVPMESASPQSFLLPYEGLGSFSAGLAVANLSELQMGSVAVTAWDENGQQLFGTSFDLAPSGHKSLMLSDLLPTATGKRGLLRFDSSVASGITGLGIRANPAGGFTSTVALDPATPGQSSTGAFSLPIGAFPHVAAGGGWKTLLYLSNPASTPIDVLVTFQSDDGGTLSLPLNISGNGAQAVSRTASSVTATIAGNSTLLVESASTGLAVTGWAQVFTNGNTAADAALAGYGVFHYTSPEGVESEGTVPMDAATGTAFVLPYESENQFGMGIALANLSATQEAAITATLVDETGASLPGANLVLPAGGHKSFMLADQVPAVAGKRGWVRLSAPAGVPITGLGIRVNPAGGLASVPKL